MAALAVLMLGPGTSITHEAVKTLTDNRCLITRVGVNRARLNACAVVVCSCLACAC